MEQPARAALVRRVQPVARRRLHEDTHQDVGVPARDLIERPAAPHLGREDVNRHRVGRRASQLGDDFSARIPAAEHRRNAGHALVADAGHFDHPAVFHRGQHRAGAIQRKIDGAQALAVRMQHFARPEEDAAQQGLKTPIFGGRQRRQQLVSRDVDGLTRLEGLAVGRAAFCHSACVRGVRPKRTGQPSAPSVSGLIGGISTAPYGLRSREAGGRTGP